MNSSLQEMDKIFSVKSGEEFAVNLDNVPICICKIDGHNIRKTKSYSKDAEIITIEDILCGILFGKYTISELPWKPTDGQVFYYVRVTGDVDKGYAYPYSTLACFLINAGNCYKTPDDALAHKDIWIEYYESMDVRFGEAYAD